MSKQRTYCFTDLTEMRGLMAPFSWSNDSMRAAINLGTGPWFCLFVDGKFRAAAEMSRFLVKLGFEWAYEFTKQEKDSYKLAQAALLWRKDKMSRQELDTIVTGLQQKYARKFDSRPLIVANRLADKNPCAVAAASCIDGVGADHTAIKDAILKYAQKVINP